MRPRIALLAAFLAGTAAAAPQDAPRVLLTAGTAVLEAPWGRLTVDLKDSRLALSRGELSVRVDPSYLHGDGWAIPGPARETTVLDPAGVEAVFPLAGDREVTLRAEVLRGVPAFLVQCRLRRLGDVGAEYYFWQTNLSADHYFAPGADAPVRTDIDTEAWDGIPAEPWLFFPMKTGGLAVFPTNVMGRSPGPTGTLFLHALPKNRLLEPGDSHLSQFVLAFTDTPAEAADLYATVRKARPLAVAPWDDESLFPAPDLPRLSPAWLRDAEIYGGYYRPAALWTDEIADARLRHVPFVIGSTPDVAALERCRARGTRLLHYVTYTCLLDTEMQVREGGTVYSEWLESVGCESRDLARHPDWVCIDRDGKIQKDAWGQTPPFNHPGLLNTCLHREGLRQAALEQIGMLMERGYDGVFVDLANHTVECHGPQFGRHEHTDGTKTNTEAWRSLQREIYERLKEAGNDRIVIHNPVTGILPGSFAYADAQMLEAYPFGGESTELRATWPEMLFWARHQARVAPAGRRIVMLSYFSAFTADTVREPALFAYAYARIFGLLFGDYFTIADIPGAQDFATELYTLRLGAATGEPAVREGVLRRPFARGLVLLNPGSRPATATLAETAGTFARNAGFGPVEPQANGPLTVPMPAMSGRVLLYNTPE